MKTKRILLLFIVGVLLLSFAGCKNATTPEGAIRILFDGLKEYDIETLYAVLTEFPNTDDCNVTYDLFSDQSYVDLYQKAYQNLQYTITDTSVTEGETKTATVTLMVTHPDLQSSYSTALYAAASLIFADENLFNEVMNNEEADISSFVPQQMQNLYTNGKIETIETQFILQLVCVEDTWKIQNDDQLKNLMSSNLYIIASTVANTTEE